MTQCEMKQTRNLTSCFPCSKFQVPYNTALKRVLVHTLFGHRSLGKVSIRLCCLIGYLINPNSSSKNRYWSSHWVKYQWCRNLQKQVLLTFSMPKVMLDTQLSSHTSMTHNFLNSADASHSNSTHPIVQDCQLTDVF